VASCSACGSAAPEAASFCPQCGAPLSSASSGTGPLGASSYAEVPGGAGGEVPGGAGGPTQPWLSAGGGPTGPGTGPGTPPGAGQSPTFDLHRPAPTELAVGAATIVVFVTLFLPWYSISARLGFKAPTGTPFAPSVPLVSANVSALGAGAGGWRILILIVCLAVLAPLVLRALYASPPSLGLPYERLVLGLAGLNGLLVLLAFLVRPGVGGLARAFFSVSWAYGAYLGLAAGIAAAVAAAMAFREAEARHGAGGGAGGPTPRA
jgi:hypothetical protein